MKVRYFSPTELGLSAVSMTAVANTTGLAIAVDSFENFFGLLIFAGVIPTSLTWTNNVTLHTAPLGSVAVLYGLAGAGVVDVEFATGAISPAAWNWGRGGQAGAGGSVGANQATSMAAAPNPWPAKVYTFSINVTVVGAGTLTASMHLWASTP